MGFFSKVFKGVRKVVKKVGKTISITHFTVELEVEEKCPGQAPRW